MNSQLQDDIAIEGFWFAFWAGILFAIIIWMTSRDANGRLRYEPYWAALIQVKDFLYVTFIDRGVAEDEEEELAETAPLDMSSTSVDVSPDSAVATPDNAPVARQQPVDAATIDITAVSLEDAREVIRFWACVEALSDLIGAGIVTNKAKAIEVVFHCTRSSRLHSTYQQVNLALARYAQPQQCDEDPSSVLDDEVAVA